MTVMDYAKLAQRHLEGHSTSALCEAVQAAARPTTSSHVSTHGAEVMGSRSKPHTFTAHLHLAQHLTLPLMYSSKNQNTLPALP